MEPLALAEVLEILDGAHEPDKPPFLGKQIGTCSFPPKISVLADFEGAEFFGKVSFQKVTFEKGVSFVGTVFHDIVDFTEAIFIGPAFFWKCTFKSDAIFRRCTVLAANHADSRRFPGEANFSYSMFYGLADFKRTHFHGLAYFHRTYFNGEANFEECRFDEFVKFEGPLSDICVSVLELPISNPVEAQSSDLRIRLRKAGLIIPNTDHPPGGDKRGFYNLNPRIQEPDELTSYMEQPQDRKWRIVGGFTIQHSRKSKGIPRDDVFERSTETLQFSKQEVRAIADLRAAYARPMFSASDKASGIFVRTEFRGGALFSEVNLDRVRFQQTALNAVIFVAIGWAKMPLSFRLGKRDALFDETQGVGHIFLERTYHDLRLGYESRGRIDVARDFYYGELELRYRAKRRLRRIFSLSFLYRFFSGYGRQQGLAGGWLFAFTLLIFPSFWMVANWFAPTSKMSIDYVLRLHQIFQHHRWSSFGLMVWRAELQSLEACTFILRTVTAEPDLQRFVAGMERIVVASQITLFLLATKWQFERNPGSS